MTEAKGKRILEWIKTALIVLLAISALLLGWRTGLFNDFSSAIPLFGNMAELMRGASGTGTTESGGVSHKEAAARPLTIVITDEEGGRYGVRYNTDERNDVYNRTSSILGEALGSASVPLEISESEWRAALARPGVYFEYITPVSLSVLDGWLDVRLPEMVKDILLRRVFVAFGEDRSRVYYQDVDNHLFFVADTASSAGKAQELEMYSANGAQFAFETGISAAENAPYMLILPGNEYPDVHAASAGSAEELLDIVIYAMGHGNETYTPPYYSNDGTLVSVGTQFRVRADAFGSVIYSRTEALSANDAGKAPDESEMIEMARRIAYATVGAVSSSAEVFFESLEYSTDRSLSVLFGYYIAGGCIHLYEDIYAAKVTFTDGLLTDVELNFRNFSLSGEYIKLIPERQALASAGGEFFLCYSDTGSERPQPSWVLYD